MNATVLSKYAAAIGALAVCAACGGGSAIAPAGTALGVQYVGKTASVNGRLVTAARPSLRAPVGLAAILPDDGEKKFEYIINDYSTYAGIFDYPKSDKQFGTINNVGGQGCTNVLYGYGKKIIWIVAGQDQIEEFEVPDTPLRTLSTSVAAPSSCAMDEKGDLAVGGLNNGDIVIFKHASGSGKVLSTPLSREYFDGYDPQGDLFFDGFNKADQFELVELPKGSSTLQIISTSNTVEFPGSVQWDGQYMVVTDQIASSMYRYSISGSTATLKGTISLKGASDCAQTWIATKVVYCADAGNENGEVFNYPDGGSPIAVFSGNFDLPLGTVAAEK
jgi:hypothetical protein